MIEQNPSNSSTVLGLTKFGRASLSLLCLLLLLAMTSCGKVRDPAEAARALIGEESYQNPRSVLLFEQVDQVGEAVVYHELKAVEPFLDGADKPIWLFLYHSLDPTFRDLIPFVEQVCEAYQGRAYVVLLEIDHNREWEKIWKVKQLPFQAVLSKGQLLYHTDQVDLSSLRDAKKIMDDQAGFQANLPALERGN